MAAIDATLARLTALHPKLIDLSLDRMWRVLGALGHPERQLPPVIHVAGTNGKGSTIAFMRAILEAAGARQVRTFNDHATPGLCIHEMGTARMGRDRKTSVLNRWNQVWDAPNVFVTDGACMTSSACQNPSLTYMALTARAAAQAVRLMKRNEL